jgi:hypothetical protein
MSGPKNPLGLHLIYHGAADRSSLWCHLTGERVELDGKWGLGFHGGEGVLVDPDGEPSLASERLPSKVEERDDGEYTVCADGAASTLHAYLGTHTVKQLAIKPVAGEPFLVEVAEFEHANSGATIWWSLQSLHEKLGLPGTASQWYHKRWIAWEGWLDKLGLPAPHSRRAAEVNTSSAVVSRSSVHGLAKWRVLRFYSVSTHALAALLVRISSKQSQWSMSQNKTYQKAFDHFMSAWLQQYLPEKATLVIYLEGVEHVPGLGLAGEKPVELKLDGGRLDVSGLLESSHPTAHKWCKHLGLLLAGNVVDLQCFLDTMFHKGIAMHLLFAQLIVLIGNMVEAKLSGSRQPQAQAPAVDELPCSQSAPRHRHARFKRKLASDAAIKLKRTVADRRLRYFMATREAFTGEQVYHMAVDASRIGKRGITAAVLALPNGVMALCPPQAPMAKR